MVPKAENRTAQQCRADGRMRGAWNIRGTATHRIAGVLRGSARSRNRRLISVDPRPRRRGEADRLLHRYPPARSLRVNGSQHDYRKARAIRRSGAQTHTHAIIDSKPTHGGGPEVSTGNGDGLEKADSFARLRALQSSGRSRHRRICSAAGGIQGVSPAASKRRWHRCRHGRVPGRFAVPGQGQSIDGSLALSPVAACPAYHGSLCTLPGGSVTRRSHAWRRQDRRSASAARHSRASPGPRS